MNNYYQNIPGWFDYEDLYREMADKYPSGHFVEIGTYKGRSAIFMLEYISDKNYFAALDVVDPWNNIGNVGSELVGEEVYQEFLHHLGSVKLNENLDVLIHRMTSLEASYQYYDNGLDFVMIDSDHDNWECYNDLRAWFTKVKVGGTIAGHDFDQPSVFKSVERFCKENDLTYNSHPGHCWVIEK